MKNVLLILLVLFCTACDLEEKGIGCPEYLSLAFLHNRSVKEFEDKIGNDIYLQIYVDDILHKADIVPYEQIKDGNTYPVLKDVTGEIEIVSWAIPSSAFNTEDIPIATPGNRRTDQRIQLKAGSSGSVYQPLGILFLGTFSYLEEDISQKTYAEINLQTSVCRFTCHVHGIISSETKGKEPVLRMDILGTTNQMDLDFSPTGRDVIVNTPFTYNPEEKTWYTGVRGLLPSVGNQYLSFILYEDEKPILTVSTKEQSTPGSIIHLDILLGSVNLTINEWRVKDVTVEWM